VLEDYYHLDRLQLETEGILRLEVVSADPIVHPIAAFQLPHEEKYVTDSYVITVNVKDGVFQSYFLPPTEEVYVFARSPRSFVCLCARLLRNSCMDLDEMLRVDRCRDMDELINF